MLLPAALGLAARDGDESSTTTSTTTSSTGGSGGTGGAGFEDRFAELGFEYDEGDANAGFADFDNDGDLDLAIASLYESHHTRLDRNDGATGFVDVAAKGRYKLVEGAGAAAVVQ